MDQYYIAGTPQWPEVLGDCWEAFSSGPEFGVASHPTPIYKVLQHDQVEQLCWDSLANTI